MKKTIIFILFLSLVTVTKAQIFLGTISNTGNTIQFKIKPTTNITSAIGYFEFNLRYSNATNLTFSALTSNTAIFPGVGMVEAPERSFGGYKYKRFLSTVTIPLNMYTQNVEYTVFEITLAGSSAFGIQLATDYASNIPNDYYFVVSDGAGNPMVDISETGGTNFYPSQTSVGTVRSVNLDVVLPLTLLDFTAQADKQSTHLKWQTVTERTASHFDIERSMDSKNWAKIGTQKAGNIHNPDASGTEGYNFTDAKAFDKTNAPYYRLKMMDVDGSFSYSPIRQVRIEKISVLKVYPNPAKEALNIEGIEATEAWQVVDILGKIRGNFVGQKVLDLKTFNEGLYFIKTASGNTVQFVVSE